MSLHPSFEVSFCTCLNRSRLVTHGTLVRLSRRAAKAMVVRSPDLVGSVTCFVAGPLVEARGQLAGWPWSASSGGVPNLTCHRKGIRKRGEGPAGVAVIGCLGEAVEAEFSQYVPRRASERTDRLTYRSVPS